MWKRKRTLKEEYGTLGHFLRGDNECHYLGDLYIEGTNFYFHREWRGVKDTAYAFARWLQTWGKMAGLIGRDPVRMIRAFWKYRWLSAYLATPMMVDKWIEGDRGMVLRADLTAIDCMVSDSITTLWREIRADRRFGENKWTERTIAFDYTLPKHIIYGFPGYYGINIQQHAAFMVPILNKNLGSYYVDQAVSCGIPGDMCTLPLVETGVAVEGEYPDIGNCWLTTNNPCDANMMDNVAMYRALSSDGKKAVHPFTTPLMYDDPTCKELGVHEVYDAIHFLESSSTSRSTGTRSSSTSKTPTSSTARRPSAGTSMPRRTTARSTPCVRVCSASTSTSRAATSTSSKPRARSRASLTSACAETSTPSRTRATAPLPGAAARRTTRTACSGCITAGASCA